ncbi:Regulatory protein RecX, partial [hydrothermal vent metagenome]
MSHKDNSRHQNIRRVAIDLLSRREHSSFELARKLAIRSFDALEIDEVLVKLRDEGLQSDVRFTEAYVYFRIQKGYGPIRIQADLKQRGID